MNLAVAARARTRTVTRWLSGLWAVATLIAGSGAQADDPLPERGYARIVGRNAFGLRDPVPPPPPPTNPAPRIEPPNVDVTLTGITEVAGVRYAHLMVPDKDRPGRFLYPTLTDDPGKGNTRHSSGLEVAMIDLATETVRIRHLGLESVLSFQDNGPAAGATPAAARVPRKPARRIEVAPTVPGPPATAFVEPTSTLSAQLISSEPLIFSRHPARANTQAANPQAGEIQPGAVSITSGHQPADSIRFVPRGPLRAPQEAAPPGEEPYQLIIEQPPLADALAVPLPPIPGLPEAGQ